MCFASTFKQLIVGPYEALLQLKTCSTSDNPLILLGLLLSAKFFHLQRGARIAVLSFHKCVRARQQGAGSMAACACTCAASSGVMASRTPFGVMSSSLRMLIMPSFLSAACMKASSNPASHHMRMRLCAALFCCYCTPKHWQLNLRPETSPRQHISLTVLHALSNVVLVSCLHCFDTTWQGRFEGSPQQNTPMSVTGTDTGCESQRFG